MKTPKQLEVQKLIDVFIEEEKTKIDSLCQLLVEIKTNGYAELVNAGNTHGDNMDMRSYAIIISNRISNIFECLRQQDFKKYQYYHYDIYDKYFKNNTTWKDILPR